MAKMIFTLEKNKSIIMSYYRKGVKRDILTYILTAFKLGKKKI
jgi:hypothetical protein